MLQEDIEDTKIHPLLFKVLGYTASELKDAVIHIRAWPRVPRLRTILNNTPAPIHGPLDLFDKLPVELIHHILDTCTIGCASTLRLLNRRTRHIVDTHRYYKLLVFHASGTIAALAQTRISNHFTILHLFETLCDWRCSACGSYGGLLWLPECKRVCFRCLEREDRFMPLPESQVYSNGVTKDEIEHLPRVQIVQAEYGKGTQKRRWLGKFGLLSQDLVKECVKNRPGHEERMWVILGDHFYRLMVTTPIPYLRGMGKEGAELVDEGLRCRGCLVATKMAHTASPDWDRLCAMRDREYLPEMFLEHLKHCEVSKRVWGE